MSVLHEGLCAHFSDAQLARLGRARVGIAGAGGLGSNVAVMLVRSGVCRLRVADDDRVVASNLNRQFFWPEDLGVLKTEALRGRLLALDPDLDFDARPVRVRPERAAALFAGCDVVVEALDGAEQKAGLCEALLAAGFFVVAASGLGGLDLPPMRVRRLGERFICVGDFSTAVDAGAPPLAPRVMQAAALQAEAVLAQLLRAEPARDMKP